MGIKKSGKKLLKLGQKAAKELGAEGKALVAKLFSKAIENLERELDKQRGASPSKQRTAKVTKRLRRREAVRRATRAKPRRQAIRPRRKAPARTAKRQRPAAAHPVDTPGPAKPEPHVPTQAGQTALPDVTETQRAP
jgi:hypothetical protein